MDTNDQSILRKLILALVIVVVVGAIVWVFFIRNSGKKPAATIDGKPDTSQQGTNANNDNQPDANGQQSANGAQAQGDSKPAAATNVAGQPTALANVGPGNVVALFTGAATIGTAAHYVYNRKRR